MLFYRFISRLTPVLLSLISIFSKKVKRTLEVRKNWMSKALDAAVSAPNPIIFHCASLGEYDQALPLIKGIEKRYPKSAIIVSFFSPSGFQIVEKKNTGRKLLYLPLDTPDNMRKWIQTLHPKAVFFARYEYWPNLMYELKIKSIPFFFFSSVFRVSGSLFRPASRFIFKLVLSADAIFVQDESSAEVLKKYTFKNVITAGDTRVDRVLDNVKKGCQDQVLNEWSRDKKILILGSIHKEDWKVVEKCLDWANSAQWSVLIASHEVDKEHIDWWIGKTGEKNTGLWSEGSTDKEVLMLDTVGLLANAYNLGDAAYIGGGFSKSIHNTLEPAAAGIPISFGPKHERFVEAAMLIENGAAFPIESEFDVGIWLSQIGDEESRKLAGKKASEFITNQQGAADKILDYIEAQSIF